MLETAALTESNRYLPAVDHQQAGVMAQTNPDQPDE